MTGAWGAEKARRLRLVLRPGQQRDRGVSTVETAASTVPGACLLCAP